MLIDSYLAISTLDFFRKKKIAKLYDIEDLWSKSIKMSFRLVGSSAFLEKKNKHAFSIPSAEKHVRDHVFVVF